jgi:uncharacterized Zn finger protein
LRKADNLKVVLTLRCADAAEAQSIADLINKANASTWSIQVASFTDYGVKYIVTGSGITAETCSCPSFVNGRNPCKHMAHVNRYPWSYDLNS